MLIPDPRRTPLPNLISHNGVILYQWEFLRARLDEGEGLPWIAMDCHGDYRLANYRLAARSKLAIGQGKLATFPLHRAHNCRYLEICVHGGLF